MWYNVIVKKIFYISILVFLGGLLFFALTDSASALISITSTSPLPRGAQNQPYTFLFQATGAESYTWQALGWGTGQAEACGNNVTKTLPPGLLLNSNGLLSGTPTQEGNFGFTALVNDDVPKKFCLTIGPPAGTTPTTLQIIAPFPPSGTTCQNYSHNQKAAGGTPPYAWSILSKPEWLNLNTQNNEGVFSGIPDETGTFNFVLRVQDGANNNQQESFSITINQGATAPPCDGVTTGGVKVPRDPSKCPQTGLVPCGTAGCPCEFCDFFVLTNNIIRWMFTWAIPTITIFMLMIGGVLFFFAGAKSDAVNQAKGIITSAIVGLLIIFISWVIINTIFDKVGIVEMPSGWKWYEVGCGI